MRYRTRIMPIVLAAIVALMISILFPVNVSGAGAGIPVDRYKVTVLPETMPLSLAYGSATWDGRYAYIFGGWAGLHGSGVIVRFDPDTNSATALLDNLPSPRLNTAAVYAEGPVFNVNNVSYIFGGGGIWYNTSGEVVRFFGEWYDVHNWPNGGLSPGRVRMSAIWNGSFVYLFGGQTSSNMLFEGSCSDDILRYAPLGAAVVVAKLPNPTAGSSAIWDGENAYIFGGANITSQQIQYYNSIVMFNPDTNEVVTMNATLPTGRAFTCAVWDGKYAYIFGGESNETDLNEILRYDPSTDTLQTLPVTLPFNTEGSVAIWNGSAAYVFGGQDNFAGTNPGDQIVMLSTIPSVSSSPGLNPALVYVPLIVVALVASSAYVFARQRKHKPEQNHEPAPLQNTNQGPK